MACRHVPALRTSAHRLPARGAEIGGGHMHFNNRLGDRYLSLLAAALLSLAAQHRAVAQNVDYAQLEQIFGQPVTTSATGSPQLASQVPADMQIITADDIRRSGATSIPDVLRFIAGIDVRSYGALDNEVAIGGFSEVYNPRLLVLINGRQVYLDDYGYTAWQTLPVQLADIRQIEVVQGPASALFGFNANSGVINIITYDPLTDRTDTLTGGFGSDGTYLGALVSTLQQAGKAGVTVSLGGIKTNEYSTFSLPAYNRPYDTKADNENYSIDARAKPLDNTELTLEVTHSDASGLEQTIIYVPANIKYRVTSVKLGAAVQTGWGLFSLDAYTNKTQDSTSVNYVNSLAANSFNEVSVVQANELVKIGNDHAVRLGLEYRSNREWGPYFNDSSDYQDYAASAMWNWQITPQLAYTTAGRVDRLVVHRGDPTLPGTPYGQADFAKAQMTGKSFNSGLVYQPDGADTFRLLFAHGEQAPSQVDIGLDATWPEPAGVTAVIAGSPFLKPSATTNYHFIYDRALPVIGSTLSTDVYLSEIRDILSSAVTLPGVLNYPYYQIVSENIGSGQALGAKIVLQGANAAGWRWNLGYTLTVVRSHTTVSGPPVTPYDYNTATPLNAVVFGAGYNWQKLEMDLHGKWRSRYTDLISLPSAAGRSYQPISIADFVTIDARIAYAVTPQLTLALIGDQLPGAQTIESAGPEVERRLLCTGTYNF
jgi:iron complex outermembrane receptor protein